MAPAEAPSALPPAQRVAVDELRFDRRNPRLQLEQDLDDQDEELELIKRLWRDFAVDEIALSVAHNGYFEHEPLFASREEGELVVVEGNRRLAAVRLLLDGELRKTVGATDLPRITAERRESLRSLPVVECDRQDIWHYIGFKHVNGAQPWQSYAKAKYVAWVHNELGEPLDSIAQRIGDRHTTVKRLYRGLMVLEQAQTAGQFDLDDRWKKHFSFSHLYTGLDYPNTPNLLGIDNETSYVPNPVPKDRLEDLGHLCLWLYGSKASDRRPLIQSQNPDLRVLDRTIGNKNGLAALRRGLPLGVAHELSIGDEELFRGHLVDARSLLQAARGKQLTGDYGDADNMGIANEILDLADHLVQDMEDSRRSSRGERRKGRSRQ